MVSYNIKILSVIKYRNNFIFVAIFWVLFLLPIVEIDLRVASKKKVLSMDEHNETSFSLLMYELFFPLATHIRSCNPWDVSSSLSN